MEQYYSLSSVIDPNIANHSLYRCLVGRFIYLTITHLDLYYLVHILNQFMHDPLQLYPDAAMWALHNLKMAPGHGIFLPASNELSLATYYDFD